MASFSIPTCSCFSIASIPSSPFIQTDPPLPTNKMGQKITCNPQKLASIVSYLQRSRTAHTIKDLEKHLPSVASINGMQVKDYVQALQDDSKIRVEKIGSGNWYWSFASEDKKTRHKALDDAKVAHEKTTSAVEELKTKLAEAEAQRDDEAEMLEAGVESREELNATMAELEKKVQEFEKELKAYSDTDPMELERKSEEMTKFKAEASQCTDEIEAMETWVSTKAGKDALSNIRNNIYGDELDEADGVLKEI